MWVQGLGIPWTLLGCSCRFRGAGKIYWKYGVRGLASPDPLVGATQDVCGVDGVRDGVSNFFPEVQVSERIQEQTVAP